MKTKRWRRSQTTDLDHDAGQGLAHGLNAGPNERLGPVRVVDVAGAVQEVEHLGGLGQGAEERVVAAGALALLVVADGGALGVAAGGLHRAVEVQGDPGQSQGAQAGQDHLA